jgi:plasmid stabilization system protein ParE
MNWVLHLSAAAEQSIDGQMRWYEAEDRHGGAELANRWLSGLEATLEKLRVHRERHGFAPENGRWHPEVELRQMHFRPWKSKPGWRVIYSLNQPKAVVTVLQVRHERRPWLFEAE